MYAVGPGQIVSDGKPAVLWETTPIFVYVGQLLNAIRHWTTTINTKIIKPICVEMKTNLPQIFRFDIVVFVWQQSIVIQNICKQRITTKDQYCLENSIRHLKLKCTLFRPI